MAYPEQHHTPQLVQLTYCSRSRITGSPLTVEEALQQLLIVSRRNNAANDISGALLYNGFAFAQVLEGPVTAVEQCFERILADTRHTSVVEVGREFIPRRLFSSWAMAYVDANSLRVLSASSVDLESMLAAGKSRPGFVLNLLRDVMTMHEAA